MLFILYLCLYLDFKELLDNMLSDTVRWPFSKGVWHACLRGKIGGREKVNKKKIAKQFAFTAVGWPTGGKKN